MADDLIVHRVPDALELPHPRLFARQPARSACSSNERFAHVRQMVLLTDDEPTQRDFYERAGFTEASAFQPGPLRAFVRLQR
ncbi:hypothetical protein MHK71_07375 [Kocuria indica]|uniref:hypothetical protein n=1 Tax=Kocuria marina TaxID=223184 RepID=UPI001EF71C1D|nr:hypothetical protein [Kocuria indica]MCG7432330.1 hypothetical protein [Kocuria indica]